MTGWSSPDGVGEIGELRFVDPGARLKSIRPHARHRDLAQRAGRLGVLARGRAEEHLESPP